MVSQPIVGTRPAVVSKSPLGATQTLLMLWAQIKLDQTTHHAIKNIAASIPDWQAFSTKASEHFLAPLCLHHLSQFPNSAWSVATKESLHAAAKPLLMKSLAHAALQKTFIQDHIAGLNIPFAITKGRPLATRYYPEPSTRYSRDIDIWMNTHDMPSVVRSAQSAGFKVYPYNRALNDTELKLHFKRRQDIALYDQRGILVELDTRLDKANHIFQFDRDHARCETQMVDGLEIPVLPTTDLFIYLCLHHTRHGWSKLIWLADIDALQQAPDFDLLAIQARAKALNVAATVNAVLGFSKACQSEDPWKASQSDPHVRDCLIKCIQMFEGGRAAEIEGVKTRLTQDFIFDWQLTGSERQKNQPTQRLKAWFDRFHPTVHDYDMLPLPMALHPLYYVVRPVLAVTRKVKRHMANQH